MSGRAPTFLGHLHARQVDRRALHPKATLGLGIAALTCLVVCMVTGATLFLYYLPDRDHAYERILHISTTLRFGALVRDLHYLSANLLVLLAVLHLARVFLTGAYLGRWLNWCIGLALLGLALAANYTGYLLPWDQVAYWAVQIGGRLAGYLPLVGEPLKHFLFGGGQVGPETLLRAFAFHAGFLPPLFLTLAALHLWRLRRDGGLVLPPSARGETIAANPWLIRAEAMVALFTLALLLGTLVIHAPIHARANPLHPPNPARSPWYFVGFQEMVSHSATVGGGDRSAGAAPPSAAGPRARSEHRGRRPVVGPRAAPTRPPVSSPASEPGGLHRHRPLVSRPELGPGLTLLI